MRPAKSALAPALPAPNSGPRVLPRYPLREKALSSPCAPWPAHFSWPQDVLSPGEAAGGWPRSPTPRLTQDSQTSCSFLCYKVLVVTMLVELK